MPKSDRMTYRAWPHARESVCEVTTLQANGRTIAIVTEISDNPGPSITNGAEAVNARLVERFGRNVVHIEHYGPMSYDSPRRPDSYDLVTIIDGKANWQHLKIIAGYLSGDEVPA